MAQASHGGRSAFFAMLVNSLKTLPWGRLKSQNIFWAIVSLIYSKWCMASSSFATTLYKFSQAHFGLLEEVHTVSLFWLWIHRITGVTSEIPQNGGQLGNSVDFGLAGVAPLPVAAGTVELPQINGMFLDQTTLPISRSALRSKIGSSQGRNTANDQVKFHMVWPMN